MPPVPRACACVWSEYCLQAEFVFALSSSSGETVDRVDRTGQFHPGLSCWDSFIDIVELSRMCLNPTIEPFAEARRIFLALRTWHICVIYTGKGEGDRREQRWFAELPAQHAIARDVPEHSPTRQESMAGVQSLAIDSHFLSLSFSLYTRTHSHTHTHTHTSPLQAIASIYTGYDQNTPRPIYSATASLVVSLILVSHRFTLQTTVGTGGVDGGEKVARGRLSTIGPNMLLVGREHIR